MHRVFAGIWRPLVGCFLAGLFAILPLVITVAIIVWVAGIIYGIIGQESFLGARLASIGEWLKVGVAMAYFYACVGVLAAILLLGLFVRMGGKRLFRGLLDQVIPRVPIVGSIYGTAAQVIAMLEKNEETDLKGMSVVYCAFGKETGVGLLALLPAPERYRFDDRDYYVVFIPTSPVPMTGGLLFAPCESVRPVDMSVESLMSVYLSMGVTGPKFLAGQKQAQK